MSTIAGDVTAQAPAIGPPLWLLAELTYRCPLHCVFCYNPVDFARHEDEMPTGDWIRVLREARAIGAVQCGFSGGEPLQRDDLEILVALFPNLALLEFHARRKKEETEKTKRKKLEGGLLQPGFPKITSRKPGRNLKNRATSFSWRRLLSWARPWPVSSLIF